MKTEEYLRQLQKDYLNTTPPREFAEEGWRKLKAKLAEHPAPYFPKRSVFPRWLFFATAVFVVFIGGFFSLIQVAQATLPGDLLYPVKRFSENLILPPSSKPETKLEHRAQEIIDLSKKDRGEKVLEKTVQEYKESVVKTRQQVSKSGNGQELQEKLEQQEKEFGQVVQDKPELKDHLDEAIQAAKEGQEDKQEKEDEGDKKEEEHQNEEGAKD